MYRRLGDPWGEAAALNVAGLAVRPQERFEGTARVRARRSPGRWPPATSSSSAMAEVNLAEYRLHAGDVEQAAELLARASIATGRCGCMYSVAYLLDAAARLAARAATPHGGAAARRGVAAARVGRRVGVGEPARAPRPVRRRPPRDARRAERTTARSPRRGTALPGRTRRGDRRLRRRG